MSQTVTVLGLAACLFGFSSFLSAQVAPKGGEKAQTTTPSHYPEATATVPPSAEDTLAYINKTLHEYPTPSFSENDACQGFGYEISIGEDRKSLVIKVRVAIADCKTVQVSTVPVADVELGNAESGAAGGGYVGSWSQGKYPGEKQFFLECINRSKCISASFLHRDGLSDPDHHSVQEVKLSAPDDVCEQLGRALRHLVLLLRSDAG